VHLMGLGEVARDGQGGTLFGHVQASGRLGAGSLVTPMTTRPPWGTAVVE